MPIRYKCQECGSVLKIKDELAGSAGHCPKCQREFTVPDAGGSGGATPDGASGEADDGDFDPVAFLMDGGEPPARPVSAATDRRQSKADTQAAPIETAADETPSEPRPRRSRLPPTESAAASADAMLGGTASSNAKHLLTRSMEESRVRAAEMPEEPEEPGVDYAELARFIGARAAPAIAAVALITVGLYMLSSSWLSSFELPELGHVSGIVTRNGEPMAGAQITFTPLDVDASSATAITNENGEFTLEYLEGIPGAVLGKNRVHVFAMDERGREVIEAGAPYGMGSNEIWIVNEGSQQIDINTDESAPAPATPADE